VPAPATGNGRWRGRRAVRRDESVWHRGHFGSSANLGTFCDLQWVTVQSDIERYPFW